MRQKYKFDRKMFMASLEICIYLFEQYLPLHIFSVIKTIRSTINTTGIFYVSQVSTYMYIPSILYTRGKLNIDLAVESYKRSSSKQ